MTICPYCGSNESKYMGILFTWQDENDDTVEERVYRCKDCQTDYSRFYKVEEVDMATLIRRAAHERD